jgi:acetyl esterase/lipase
MSLRMRAAAALLRLTVKPRLSRMSLETARRPTLPDPPSEVAHKHSVEAEHLGSVRVVWLDRDRACGGTIVYVHGGSFISGPYAGHWKHLSRLVQATGFAGAMVDYRLAPEHPYPAAHDDVTAAVRAGFADGILSGARYGLCGDGSGGGLAIAVAARLYPDGMAPAALVLSSPELDLTLSHPDAAALEASDVMLSCEAVRRFNAAYVGDADWMDPSLSPKHGTADGLPPLMIHSSAKEIFAPDIRDWVKSLEGEGRRVRLREESAAFHSFALASPRLPEVRRALADQAAFLSQLVRAERGG